ncbi:MAG TPA: prepilin-type N-terminal cleavage/methylation domain-containing protein [Armatimonadetes bacterium]|nr:prepilin-type N-terminal cleavage/methylation domain-containing protein [Armatimonadota bacterium]
MHSKGFTLLELIVALAIMTLGLVGVLHALSAALVASRTAEDYTTAAMLAQQKLEELLLLPEPEVGEDAGDFGELFPRFQWESTVEETELENYYHLSVTVSWQTGRRVRQYTAETCVTVGTLTSEEATEASR